MEVLVVHAKDHLNSISSGYAPLHAATIFGHTRIINLMAAQVNIHKYVCMAVEVCPIMCYENRSLAIIAFLYCTGL